jgi:hypothetical protein
MERKYLRPDEVEQIYRINAKTQANWRSQGRGSGLSQDRWQDILSSPRTEEVYSGLQGQDD